MYCICSLLYSLFYSGIYTPAKKGVEVPFVVKPDLDLASRFGSCLSDLKKSIDARKVDADLTEMVRFDL